MQKVNMAQEKRSSLPVATTQGKKKKKINYAKEVQLATSN